MVVYILLLCYQYSAQLSLCILWGGDAPSILRKYTTQYIVKNVINISSFYESCQRICLLLFPIYYQFY